MTAEGGGATDPTVSVVAPRVRRRVMSSINVSYRDAEKKKGGGGENPSVNLTALFLILILNPAGRMKMTQCVKWEKGNVN